MVAVLLVAYLIAIFLISAAVRRRNQDFVAFVLANRSLSTVVASLSLIATKVGAAIMFGTVAAASTYGLVASAFPLSAAIGFTILGLSIARTYNKTGIYTVPEFIERNYNHVASLIVALMLVIYLTIVLSIQFTAGGAILSSFTGLPPGVCVGLFALVTAGAVILGGMWGIVYVDILQLAWIYVGFGILALNSIVGSGGLSFILTDNLSSVGGATSIGAGTVVGWFVASVANALVSQGFVLRMSAAKDPRSASRAAVLAGLTMIPLALCITFIGMGSRYMNPEVSGQDALIYQASLMPSVLSAFLLMAVFAVITSSVENILQSVSVIVQRDVIERVVRQEHDKLRAIRIVIALSAVAGMFISLLVKRDIISTWVFAASISGVAIVVPVLFAFSGRKSSVAAIGSLLAPVAIALSAYLFPVKQLVDPTTLGLVVAVAVYGILYAVVRKPRHIAGSRADDQWST